jgi:poly(3-hydroxybutyrate) depolymerase
VRLRFALLVVVVLALASLAAFVVAPALDPRWQVLDASHAPTLSDRLARTDRRTLLFVPGAIARNPTAPVTIVLVLAGLGGDGRAFAEEFVPTAEAKGWLLIAPSPDYDPATNETLLWADQRVDDELVSMVDSVMATSFHVAPRIDVVGFSRGAQSAHRFALRHPERVNALASFSAGTYTMPTSSQPYPLGMGDFATWNHQHAFDPMSLREVRVLVGVGDADTNPQDVVRAWDVVGGPTRLDRGIRFAQALGELSVPHHFQSYAGVGHRFVPQMRADAIAWFAGT